MKKLPRTNKPVFTLEVPSTGEQVVTRPFVSSDEKILLVAQESGSDKDILLAIKQVIQNCVQDDDFDANDLATFDLEYMFLKLRARSVNNMVEVTYRDSEDGQMYDIDVNLDDVQLVKVEGVDPKIMLDKEIGIVMKYPSVTILDDAPEEVSPAELIEYMIRKCIDCIFDMEDVYPVADYSEEEMTDWLGDLNSEEFAKICFFFDNMPKMYYKIEYTNSKGTKREIELTTLSDFFTWG